MATPAPNPTAILVATDNVTDAALVKRLLQEEFGPVFVSTVEDAAGRDFERYRPAVLVLAFNTLEKAERYYLGLYRLCSVVQAHPHRTVILCNKDEVKRVYELCKKRHFDDYVHFWPMTHDMSRLAMAVHQALRELGTLRNVGPSPTEFAAQARRLMELEGLLNESLAEGNQHIARAGRATAEAGRDIGVALDGFSRRLIDGTLPGAVTVKDDKALQQEIDRLRRDEIDAPLRLAAESATPLMQWADDFRQACTLHIESARALNVLDKRVQATVLIVDDDEFQHKIVASILGAQNHRLLFASNGLAALSLLRKERPDLILMDVEMPDMDGIEATRRLKASPTFAGVPVIMITGKSARNVVSESLKAGANDFVVKPFDRDTLVAKVREALERT